MTRSADRLDAFTYGYAYTMLWANVSSEDGEVSPDWWQTPAEGWELDAFTPAARAQVAADCGDFMLANVRDLMAYTRHYGDTVAAWRQAGGDFALTRNHHGAGYWDRGVGAVGDRLTSAAHVYGDCNGDVGPDDLVTLF